MAEQPKRPRICLVAGATRGLGKAVSLAYARQGARLVLVGAQQDKAELEKVAHLCASIGAPGCDMHACDTANPEHLQNLAQALLSWQGRVDVLAFIPDQAQAGADGKSASDGDPDTWERQLAAGMLAPMRMVAELAPDMARRGRGAVIAAVWDPPEAQMAGGAGEAAAKAGLTGWMHGCYESLRGHGISTTLVKIKGGREETVAEAAEAFLLPFRLSPNCTPEELTVGSAEGDAAAATVSEDAQPLQPEAWQQSNAEHGEMKGACGGVVEATGARLLAGLMLRDAEPNEIGQAKSDTPGTVLTPSNPALLEPETAHFYEDEPPRSPQLLVQCQKPLNGETPHALLVGAFVTPADIHFVRNHMPVPRGPKAAEHSITIDAPGVGSTQLSLQDIRTEFKAHTFCSVLQCAGNRRSEMAAQKLVEGRAPWNSGGMGNARWTGALLRDVLGSLWPQELDLANPLNNQAQHVCFIGADQHGETGTFYEGSIPLAKALDPLGDVLLAYEMNGRELLPDHSYPLRVIVPGYVGARQVKWLTRIALSENESEAPWQKKDYKLLPQSVTDHEGAEGPLGWTSMPAVEVMPVQSAILTPEAGSVFAAATTNSIKVRGYAWSGGGVPIVRVDVSTDGASWAVARVTGTEARPSGRMWAWTTWEAEVAVPDASRKKAGPLRIVCKAMDAAGNTQPEKVATVWNFRGLCCNSWGNTIVRLE